MNTSRQLNGYLGKVELSSESLQDVMTPFLAVYPDLVDANITTIINLLGGKPDRWQPHIKTTKSLATIRQLISRGTTRFKCATTLELLCASEAGAKEVLVAYPSTATKAKRIQEISLRFPDTFIAATVEEDSQLAQWRNSRVGLYIDVNPGMNRTGIEQRRVDDIVELAKKTVQNGNCFAGLHYYDGHHRQPDIQERMSAAYVGYEQLIHIVEAIETEGITVETVVTSGTPALPCALAFPGFRDRNFSHRVSSGTIVYGDLTSMTQIPEEWDLHWAAVVVASVVSRPAPFLITCDAGHKAISSDAGFPNCAVLGHPEFEPKHPSEEHLPIAIPKGGRVPEVGEILYLIPRHVCTTVNNFDEAMIAKNGGIVHASKIDARGRERALTMRPDLAQSAETDVAEPANRGLYVASRTQ
jgi:D-serine deaminase-like pyridoxal phosphate-dependent protein